MRSDAGPMPARVTRWAEQTGAVLIVQVQILGDLGYEQRIKVLACQPLAGHSRFEQSEGLP